MWKTLYDMFGGESKEQELYHSIATVGTLLLEIGEVGKRFYLHREELLSSSSLEASTESASESSSLAQSTIPEIKEDDAFVETKTEQGSEVSEIINKTADGAREAVVDNVSTKLKDLDLENESGKNQITVVSENLKQTSDQSTVDNVTVASASTVASGSVHRGERTISTTSSKVDVDWSISFEQFLASMLTESALVRYFEKSIDLQEAVDKTRHRRLLMRQQSAPFEDIDLPTSS